LDGEIKEFYSNGKLKLEGFYLDGKKNGEWREYNEDGKLLKVIRWKDDIEKK
jgi:antitoxin component YwqK of YwqJK toxin-antitoxin module